MKNSAHLLSPQIGNAGDPHAPLFAPSTTCEISCETISGMPLSPSRVRAGTAVGDVTVVVTRVLVAGRMPTGVTALVEDRVQQWIRSELPERLLGVPPGLVKVGQQPARGILVHVRIEVDRDVAGRPSQ